MSKRSRYTLRNVGGTTPLGNKRGPWHIIDTRNPDRVIESHPTRRAAYLATRVLNLLQGTKPCPHYRPDHNGECLLCDEPAGAHPWEQVAFAERMRNPR